jgi:hypothetical protein
MQLFSECARCLVRGELGVAIKVAMLPSFLAAIAGSAFVASKLESVPAKTRVLVGGTFAAMILFVATPIILISDIPARYSPLTLHEGPFDWPAGCAEREYQDNDPIDISCHDYRNAMSRELVYDHGFDGLIGRNEHDYFRVGSEAINFSCNYFTEKCTVRHAEHGVFVNP